MKSLITTLISIKNNKDIYIQSLKVDNVQHTVTQTLNVTFLMII